MFNNSVIIQTIVNAKNLVMLKNELTLFINFFLINFHSN